MVTSASDGTFSVVPPFGASEKVTVSVLHNENASRHQVELDASGSYRGGPLMLELNSESSRYTIGGSVFSNGVGSEGVLVAAYAIKDTGGSFQIGPENTIGWAWTNADGRYFMEVATPSISQITMHILGPESFQMGTLPIIQLKPGHNEIDSIEFADQHGKRTLRGEIMDLNGDPVAGARIMAIVEQSKTQLLRQEEAQEKQDTSGTSDADGKFECKNLSLEK